MDEVQMSQVSDLISERMNEQKVELLDAFRAMLLGMNPPSKLSGSHLESDSSQCCRLIGVIGVILGS